MKFYDDDIYLNSLCMEGTFLHNYEIVKTYDHGVIEKCSKCKDRKYFSNNGSNKRYLSYHVRQSLQPYQHFFYKEYPNFKKI